MGENLSAKEEKLKRVSGLAQSKAYRDKVERGGGRR